MTKTYLPVSLFPLFATLVAALTPVRTRRAEAEALAARGITGAAADLLLSESGGARHVDRLLRALTAALAWSLCWDEEEEAEIRRFVTSAHGGALALVGRGGDVPTAATLADAWTILTLEIGGVGGRHGAEGIGTARHPAFALTCGSGRKNAGDGAAWTAAIAGARELVAGALYRLGYREPQLGPVKDGDGVWSLVVRYAPHDTESWIGRSHHPEERPWYRAEATRGLLLVSQNRSPEAPRWAELYNELHKKENNDNEGTPNERARNLIREYGTDADRRILSQDDQLLSAAGGLDAADVVRWDDMVAKHGGEVTWPEVVPIHHADHGVPRLLLWWALEQVELDGFFVRTFELPGANLPCGLHGPVMDDLPVPEEEVVRYQRTPDRPASRCVARPPRSSDLLTVIGTATKDGCQIFTAYGGPLAPREPGDPTLPAEGPEREESEAFWATHALSLPAGAVDEATDRQLAADDVGEELAALELGQASASSALIQALKVRIDREKPVTGAFVSDLEVQLAKCRARGLLDGASAFDLLALARERLDESLS